MPTHGTLFCAVSSPPVPGLELAFATAKETQPSGQCGLMVRILEVSHPRKAARWRSHLAGLPHFNRRPDIFKPERWPLGLRDEGQNGDRSELTASCLHAWPTNDEKVYRKEEKECNKKNLGWMGKLLFGPVDHSQRVQGHGRSNWQGLADLNAV